MQVTLTVFHKNGLLCLLLQKIQYILQSYFTVDEEDKWIIFSGYKKHDELDFSKL